jgi:cytoskeletal protein RodZ
MEHRRTPTGKAFVPASWFIVLTIMLCVGAAGWLGWLFVDNDPDTPAASPTTSSTTPATTPTPTPSKTTETTDEPTPTPSKTTEKPVANRDVPVAVLNNTTIQGLAATYSAKVRSAGWANVTIGNWRGSIAGNTVYFPPQLEQQAKVLGDDLDIGRIMPSIAPMRTDRLTIILSGPQQ